MSTEIVAVNIEGKKQLDRMQTRKQLRILMATIPVPGMPGMHGSLRGSFSPSCRDSRMT